jgi:cytochrome c oxidase subunit 4
MHDHAAPAHHHHAHDDHTHGGVGKYLAVFAGLCVLTLISFGVARSSLMNTPSVGWAIMMAVSCAKAMLVIAFFMHLIWEANWKYVLTIPASIMSLFLVLMLVPDIGFRTRHYSEDRLIYAPPPGPERSIAHGEKHHGPPLPFTEQDVKAQADHQHEPGEKH